MPGLLSSTPSERFPGRKSLSYRPGAGQKLEKNIDISTQTMTQRPQEASCHQIHIRSLSEREAHTSCLTRASRIHSWNLSIDWKLKPHPPNVSGVCLEELCFLLLGHGYVGVCSSISNGTRCEFKGVSPLLGMSDCAGVCKNECAMQVCLIVCTREHPVSSLMCVIKCYA